jgi:ABC-type methionine transport system permease subunit
MYSFSIVPDFPLLNAVLQTLLLFVCPFVIAILLGGSLGMWLFFNRHPLFTVRARHHFSVTPFPYARAMIYLGVFPILLALLLNILHLEAGTAVLLLLSLGAIFYLAFHLYRELYTLDASILEMALASGLDHQAMIRRVLIPMGKFRIAHALCETALFLLALESAAGFFTGLGLTGFAILSGFTGTDWLQLLLCLLLLVPLFLLVGYLSSRYAKKSS